MNDRSHNTRLLAWLRLLRVPNLFTVPGDPIVGFLLASSASSFSEMFAVWPCLLASMFLYMAGLISNDYFDLEEDRRERPDRPLPSGAVNPRTALVVSLLLTAGGLGFAAVASMTCLLVALILSIFILTYNIRLKRYRLLGPLNMGICRGLSILLGGAAVPYSRNAAAPVLAAAACMIFYILNVTVIAADETKKKRISARRWMPATIMIFAFFFLHKLRMPDYTNMGLQQVIILGSALAAIYVTFRCGWALSGEPEPAIVSRTIGQFIRALIPFQAAMIALSSPLSWAPALALLALWPFAALLARKFYAS